MDFTNTPILNTIKEIVTKAREAAYRSSNTILLQMYWEIGKTIVEEEQGGHHKAKYGKGTLKQLSHYLTIEFGKGFDERNLNNMRAFYIAFPIWYALRTKLSWTHYRLINRLDSKELRTEYVSLAITGNWNTRVLQRNINSLYVQRTLLPQDEKDEKFTAKSLIKDPYIFEFLQLDPTTKHSENNIETSLINHLQSFIMELGKGFAFVARQQHIVTDTNDFYIDLVFYNYYLKCFVLIDLKTDELTHAAIGQMDMYVRMYNDLKTGKDDNPTIGIILCTTKDEVIVKYSVLADNEKLFASKYRLYLPNEEELKTLIETDRVNFKLNKQ